MNPNSKFRQAILFCVPAALLGCAALACAEEPRLPATTEAVPATQSPTEEGAKNLCGDDACEAKKAEPAHEKPTRREEGFGIRRSASENARGTDGEAPPFPPPAERNAHKNFPGKEQQVPPPISQKDAKLLKSLFSMSDAELRRLREVIQRIEKLSPERRMRIAADFDRIAGEMSNHERDEYMKGMRERFRKNQENLLERYFASLSPEQADNERRKFLSLGKNEQRDYLFAVREKLGLQQNPPPPRAGLREREKAEKQPQLPADAGEATSAPSPVAPDSDTDGGNAE